MHVLPTIQGWVALALVPVLLAGIAWQRQPTAPALALALTLALAVSWVVARRSLRRCRLRWLQPQPCHAGEVGSMGVVVHDLDQPLSLRLAGEDDDLCLLPAHGPAPVRAAWPVTLRHRGLHPLPAVELRCEWPFGLLLGRRLLQPDVQVLVWPALGRLRRNPIPALQEHFAAARFRAARGEDELSHLRPFRPGDALRAIHWRASARFRAPMVAERQVPFARSLTLAVDTGVRSVGRPSPRLERLISAAATLADHLLGQGWDLRLRGPGGLVTGSWAQIFEALALMQARPAGPWQDLVVSDEATLVLTLHPHLGPEQSPHLLVWDLRTCERMMALPRSRS